MASLKKIWRDNYIMTITRSYMIKMPFLARGWFLQIREMLMKIIIIYTYIQA